MTETNKVRQASSIILASKHEPTRQAGESKLIVTSTNETPSLLVNHFTEQEKEYAN